MKLNLLQKLSLCTILLGLLTTLPFKLNVLAETSYWSTDPSVNTPVVISTKHDDLTEIVSNDEGGAYILYTGQNNGSGIYLKKINPDGSIFWSSEMQIGVVFDWLIGGPQMIPDMQGGVIVVWEEKRNDFVHVYAQKIDGSGNRKWGPTGLLVSTNVQLHGRRPQIVQDNQGGVIVSWGYSSGSGTESVYVQRISPLGELMWGDNGLRISEWTRGAVDTKITTNSTGGAYVLFRDKTPNHLWVHHVGANGNKLWSRPLMLSETTEGSLSDYQLVFGKHNNIFIAWKEVVNNQSQRTIQIVSQDGQSLLNNSHTKFPTWGEIIPTGNEVIVLNNVLVNPWDADIYFSTLLVDNGNLVQSSLKPLLVKEGYQNVSDYIVDDMDTLTLVWTDSNTKDTWINSNDPNELNEWDIYAQRINADGDLLWDEDAIVITNAASLQSGALLTDSSSSFILAWTDERNGISTDDIYAQRINLDGTLGPEATPTPTSTPTETPTQTNTPTPTLTPTPTIQPDVFELPIVYEGRKSEKKSAENKFKKAFKEYTTAYFDHYFARSMFASFTGKLFNKNISVTDCSPTRRCYDSHNGVDFRKGDNRKTILSVANGRVVYASAFDEETQICTEESSYGCVVLVAYNHKISGPVFGLYGHLATLSVQTGSNVEPSRILGYMGNTGCPGCGVHLHFSVLKEVQSSLSSLRIQQNTEESVPETTPEEWSQFIRSLPSPDGDVQTDQRLNTLFEPQPYCSYLAPDGKRYAFIDPSGWKGDGQDPWTQREDGEGAEKGCGAASDYLWKFDVGKI